MSTPIVKRKAYTEARQTTAQSSDPCAICTPHLMSDHFEEKTRQCNKCSCVAQDTDRA